MITPSELKYSKEHEWVKVEGNIAVIGITDFAQNSLGNIVFLELPQEGDEITAGDTFGVVESVKAASDLYVPVSGSVIEVNEDLLDAPQAINKKPYDSWMIKVEMSDPGEAAGLLNAQQYQEHCAAKAE